MSATQDPQSPGSPSTWRSQAPLFILLALVTFSFPLRPSLDLDASWRMALGKFFLDHLQFGRDVVFTYGPLGFLMGKTYSGLLYWSLIAWHLFAACTFATIIIYWGRRLKAGWSRFVYYGFFLLFGVTYEDSIHMLVIALTGFELLRRTDRPWHWSSVLFLLLLAVQSAAKFTNLMFAALVVSITAALSLWQHQRSNAIRTLAWFGGGFLTIWMLCLQNPLNLPAYFINSWHVSQGYQEVMGIATPDAPFKRGLFVLGVLIAYVLLNLLTQKDRPRTLARSAILGALVYLNWKHGFVRADGHMIGFFYAALLPIVAFPVLLDDGVPLRWLKRVVLGVTGVLCLLGIRDAILPQVDAALAIFQDRVWTNTASFAKLPSLREDYDRALREESSRFELPRTKAIVGEKTLDVLGFNQGIAIYNNFNYRPRPVFQSYSVYTPELLKLNVDFYRSDRAPEFVLLKVEPIDERLGSMDDSAVLHLLMERYRYVHTEKFFQLWEKKPEPFTETPRPLVARKDLPFEEVWNLTEYQAQALWLTIDIRPSLLGRIRNFFYKPPMLRLALTDSNGLTTTYRMAAPIGRAGFIVNPVVTDLIDFTYLAAGVPEKKTKSIMLTLAKEDRKYFAAPAKAELTSFPLTNSALEYFKHINREVFFMFKTPPTSFDPTTKPSMQQISGQDVMVMHAPSEMVFDLPAGATTISGKHGYVAGAYTNGGRTNGGDFVIAWSNGLDTIEVYRRSLDPLNRVEDRGLLSFQLDITKFKGGKLYLRTTVGNHNDSGWDWTAWTDIEIK
ncbi:hypothetical protein [Oleiharenicola lentus]|uniref:hypothetical protein n=1 Tax=Oleiharenicola lentus TaxID=2508720 RepID=UPI003F67BD20